MQLLGELDLWAWFSVPFQLHELGDRLWSDYTVRKLLQRYPSYVVHLLNGGLRGLVLDAWS